MKKFFPFEISIHIYIGITVFGTYKAIVFYEFPTLGHPEIQMITVLIQYSFETSSYGPIAAIFNKKCDVDIIHITFKKF